jgi:hypothetical protein
LISVRLFNIAAAIGVALIAAFGVMLFSTQQAFPFFIGKAGTFLISGDNLELEGFNLGLGLDDNSSESGGQLPSGEITADVARVSGLVLEKEFNVASVVGNVAQPEWKFRLTTGSEVVIQDVTILASGLCGDSFVAGGLVVDGKGADTPTFTDDFNLSAGSVTLVNGAIEAGYLATDSLSISGLSASVAPGGYDKPDCLP